MITKLEVCFVSRGTFSVPEYFTEHNISGDVLTNLDQESLKEVGVQTIGQRLAILKAVYHLKLAHNVPIDPDHYVPPCTSLRPEDSNTHHTYLVQRKQMMNKKV